MSIVIKVLGSGAGGGLPQWNCFCENCVCARNCKILSRSQSSIAISVNNGKSWNIINVSPDIRYQLNLLFKDYSTFEKRPKLIDRIFLTDAQIDHTIGLFSLRESKELNILCEDNVKNEIKYITDRLNSYLTIKYNDLETEFENCKIEKIYVKCKPPPFSDNRENTIEGDTVALKIINTNNKKYLFYCPGISEITKKIKNIILNSEMTFIDGTIYNNEETLEYNNKTGLMMGHISNIDILNYFKEYDVKNKIKFIHINNTNPINYNSQLVYNKICYDNETYII